jgi:hypothetical protein
VAAYWETVDWELVVAFIRRDFPPDQRDAAREMAAVLAELVGIEIKQLRPEHTLKQIAEWETSDLAIADKNLSLTTLGLTIPPLLLSYCNIATVNLKPHYQKYDCNSRHTAINASSRKFSASSVLFLIRPLGQKLRGHPGRYSENTPSFSLFSYRRLHRLCGIENSGELSR